MGIDNRMTEVETERESVLWWRTREEKSLEMYKTDRKIRMKHERRLKKLEGSK